VTTIFVTHDQEEALEVAQQVAVINAGRIEQTGTPDDLYERPANPFVMGFVGPVSRLGDRWVRPHDIELLEDERDGAVQALIERVARVGFEVRIETVLGDGSPVPVLTTRQHAEELELRAGQIDPRAVERFRTHIVVLAEHEHDRIGLPRRRERCRKARRVAALEAGASRIHGAALGIGERVGNTPMDLLLVNLVVMGFLERDLSPLMEYVQKVSEACDVPIPDNYPVVGKDAFRTATGVHAAAVIKAWKKGDRDLMDAVYSAVLASLVGRHQEIEVGPMSGKSNVVFWLEQHGIPCSDPIIDRVFAKAKSSTTVLTEAEILAEVYR
jgi:hypothetical protein